MNIATARKNAKLTQTELAVLLGVTTGAVSQWEMVSGTRPTVENARKLMALLPGLTFDDIYPPAVPVGKAA